jgi:hypothetical protein
MKNILNRLFSKVVSPKKEKKLSQKDLKVTVNIIISIF